MVACPAWAHEVAAPTETANPLLSPEDRKTYAAAFHQAAGKRFARARALAAQAKDRLPAKVIQWLELIDSDRRGPFAESVDFLAHNAHWPGQAALQLRAEQSMTDDLPDPRVLAWFKARAPLTVDGAMRYASALIASGDATRAARVLRTVWIDRDFSRREERTFRERFAYLLRREDDLARLDRLLWDQRHRAAKRQARRLGGGYPALAEARLLLARLGSGVDAAIRRVPDDLRSNPGLVFERARWRQRKRRYASVIELLDPPDLAAPRPERWWTLRHWAVRQALIEGDISVAYRMAEGHGLEAGLDFAQGEWLAGWIALRFLDQPQDAYRHFRRLYEGVTSPISLARSAFWAGESARALDARDPAGPWRAAARRWYLLAAEHQTSFYGQLAGRRLGQPTQIGPPSVDRPGPEARADFDARELVRVVRMLGELGERKLQERFLARLRVLADTAGDYALVAKLADEQGRPDLALQTAKTARRDGIILPEHLFPAPSLPHGDAPEPALVLAVIRQESAFHSEAISRAGARGLMQLLPRTARHVAHRLNVRYSRKKLIGDPAYNLRLGRAYLSELIERYDGSYVLALAAYNAGPARADHWIDALGDPRDPQVDPVDWIESIPLDETRNYVQRVLEGLSVYRRRLDMEASQPTLAPALGSFGAWTLPKVPNDLSCCL